MNPVRKALFTPGQIFSNGVNLWANLLTSLSLLCGFVSIIFSLESHFTFASWSIILSVIFDGLDGQIARLNPLPSDFGKELDSLVDVVAFGIAPAVLGYIFIYRDFYLYASAALFLYLFCGVMRLAQYNVTPKESITNYFHGLPTTVSGGMLASFILIYRRKVGMESFEFAPALFLLLVIVLSFLMVSRIKYLNLDGLRALFGKKSPYFITAVFVIFVAGVFLHKAGITLTLYFLIYLIFSPFVVKFCLKDK